jgi:hypothetical protein
MTASLISQNVPLPARTSSPGMNSQLLLCRMAAAIIRCNLRLRGFTVLTEAATGPYIVTPVLAAMAGADVFAVTRDTGFGSVEDVREATFALARCAGVSERICVIGGKSHDVIRKADIITNSGHVRPIDAAMVRMMRPTAVIPLMYESWELREADVDIHACQERGIAVAGTNESHPEVDVFSFLGVLAVKLLVDAGIPVHGCNILLLCDNSFSPFIEYGLRQNGATVYCAEKLPRRGAVVAGLDAILVALRPRSQPVLRAEEAAAIAQDFPGAVVAQFWGDVDRQSLAAEGLSFWPLEDVAAGHMGILPSALGPEPVIRLQCGGLKVGEVMASAVRREENPIEAVVNSNFGQVVQINDRRNVIQR